MIYLKILRLDHGVKHLFVLPGIFFALFLIPPELRFNNAQIILNSVLVFFGFLCIGSANYLVNELLDRDLDHLHPLKSKRALVGKQFNKKILAAEYLALLILGLFSIFNASSMAFISGVLFFISGIIYNVEPIRLKDRPYWDILSESVNNSLRLTAGWGVVSNGALLPTSLFISFWAIGGYMMAIKRLSEYRFMSQKGEIHILKNYRKSFAHWNEQRLLLFVLGSLSTFAFFFGVFLVRYKPEYTLLLPLIILQPLWYFKISMEDLDLGQKPELIYKKRNFILVNLLFLFAFTLLTLENFPWIRSIFNWQFA